MPTIARCRYCSAEATHRLRPNRETKHWEATPLPAPWLRGLVMAYCQRCAEALASGIDGETWARQLNEAYRREQETRDGHPQEDSP